MLRQGAGKQGCVHSPPRDKIQTDLCEVAVTLEGTVIHKSGLITGGKSSHNTGKKWEEKEIQGSPNSMQPIGEIH